MNLINAYVLNKNRQKFKVKIVVSTIFSCAIYLVHCDITSSSSQPSCFHSKNLGSVFPFVECLGEIVHLAHHLQFQDFQEKSRCECKKCNFKDIQHPIF